MDNKRRVLEEAVAQLPGLVGAEVRDGSTPQDLALEVSAGERTHTFTVHVTPSLTKSRAGVLLTQLPKNAAAPLLVASDRITTSVAELLRTHDVCYVDADGNCFLRGGELFVLIEGRQRGRKTQRPIRAFQETGLKLIFFLLLDPDLVSQTYRELAGRAGISRGAVGYVMSDLTELGYVLDITRGRRKLQRCEELTRKWATGYAETLRPKLARRRFRFRDGEQCENWQDVALASSHSLWGGEPAADLVTGYLRPEGFTLYTRSSTRALVETTQFVPDPEGGIEVLDAFWEPGALAPYQPDDLPVAPPLLIYADLVASGHSRNLDTARLIYEDHLRGR